MNHNRHVHDAVRSMRPGEMRLFRGLRSRTVTLITGKASQKRAFVQALQGVRKRVSCIRHDGPYFWLVQVPSGAARQALRKLGWVEVRSTGNSMKPPSEPSENPLGEANRSERAPTSGQKFRPCRPRWRERRG